MPDIVAKVISPAQLNPIGDPNPFPIEIYSRRCLAQGDSWFSIGAVPPWATTCLPDQFVFSNSMVIVNCAYPGRELAHMTETTSDREFLNLLGGPLSYKWDAILVSGGGNDLSDALSAPPVNQQGDVTPLDQRLLRTAGEWGPPGQGPLRYISESGWVTFSQHMELVFKLFLDERDKGQNASTPVICHTYDFPTPRDAPALRGVVGPWLYSALHDLYGIPQSDWVGLSDLVFGRMVALLLKIATENAARQLVVVDSANTITRAAPGTTGPSGDWQNEIHPTPHGYSLLANTWRPVVEPLLWP